MKRRNFFKAALALAGVKALGVKANAVESIPNPEWVDAEPQNWHFNLESGKVFVYNGSEWKEVEE